jgi:hypothetical protein
MGRLGNLTTLLLLGCVVSSTGYGRSISYDIWTADSGSQSSHSVALPTSSACGGDVGLAYANSSPFCLANFTSLSFAPGFTAGQGSYTPYETFSPGSAYQSGYASAYVWAPEATFTNGGGVSQPLTAFTTFQFAPVGLSPDPPPDSATNLSIVLITPYSTLGSAAFATPNSGPIGFTIAFDELHVSSTGVVTDLSTCAGTPATFTVNHATYTAQDPCKSGDVAFDFLNGGFHDATVGGLLGTNSAQSVLPNGWSCVGAGCPGAVSAPEIDPASAASAMTLLFGVIAVLRARRRNGVGSIVGMSKTSME